MCFPKVIFFSAPGWGKNVFTDGSSTGRAVLVSPPDIDTPTIDTNSAQVIELVTVQMALEKYADIQFNLYTNSKYTSKILASLETAAYIASGSRVQM